MPLIPGICSQCGATLSVERGRDAMICPYCKTPFVVENAIQLFNSTYNIVNNITAKKVIVQNNIDKDFEIIGGVLKKYNGSEIDVVIPFSVLRIASDAFTGTMIKSVKMSDELMEIDPYAFKACRYLENVILSKKIKHIGYGAFWHCNSLVNIVIPEGLMRMDGAFQECSSLTSVILPRSITEISPFAFVNCNSLTSITIPENVACVGDGAFAGCSSLTSIKIPESVTSIGKRAFSNCDNLETIYLSSSLLHTSGHIQDAFAKDEDDEGYCFGIGCNKLMNIYVDGVKLNDEDELLKYFRHTIPGKNYVTNDRMRNNLCFSHSKYISKKKNQKIFHHNIYKDY